MMLSSRFVNDPIYHNSNKLLIIILFAKALYPDITPYHDNNSAFQN